MTEESRRIRLESWIQFVMLVFVLIGALVINERRLTRVEVLIQTYEGRLEKVESLVERLHLPEE